MYHQMFGTMVPGQIEARFVSIPFSGLGNGQRRDAAPNAAVFIHGQP
jgi:hypothetical protein